MELRLRNYQEKLINKVRQAFIDGYKNPCIVLGCGGGKTVLFSYMAKQSQDKGNTVWFLVHRRELLDQTIETFNRFGIERKTIHIGMVGSYSRNLDKYPKPDFIIFDECHFSAAKTWQRIIDKFPDAKIAGLTATPSRLDGKPLDKIYDSLIVGDSAKTLIKNGYLSPYKYYAPTVTDLSSLTKKRGDFDKEQASELLSTRAVFGDVVKHYKNLADGKQTICYCSSIKHSKEMAEEFKTEGINAVHFDGDTPKKQRTKIIKDFRNKKIQILCNVDLISVGFDCPDVDCCILLRPTMSTALYIQQSNRALRFREGKVAIILDHVNNYERHGLPDDEREWSLNNKLEGQPSYQENGELILRQCINCYNVFKSSRICPYCGFENELQHQEIENIKGIELREIKDKKEEEAKKIVLDYRKPEDCTNVEELKQFAKNRNYKSGWIYFQMKSRGWM
ncbi:DEAD/DEAH box helicase [Tissierella creatinophila]|uniref:UvrABC system protein B n=1 Tax=Tissierella creatinophila DSM 6911 TaxID=1123403 RepID=A0A1U7M6F3_TISCR|nr:DEAD/DEAH box helicase [Tissierella creatinophila]OLS02903.1 UvrABC system protein B [Tissierella creatinophila DSM 6911]